MTGCTGSDGPKDATVPSHDADFAKTMNVADSLYNCMQFRDAYKLYLQLLDTKEAEADSEKRLSVLNSLCNSSELSGHKAEQHKWLQQLHDLAEQTGNDYYQSLAHITMGQNLFYEGDREKGIQNVTEAIDLIAKTDLDVTDHLTHGYLNLLASMYGAMKDYDNALKTTERNLRLTMDGTRWGAAPSQQLIDRRMALAKKASVLAQMGRSASGSLQARYYQQADSAYAAWKAVQYEGNHTRDYFIVDYMKKRGRYQEAAIYHEKEQQQTIMQQQAENTRQEAIILIIVLVLIAVATLAAVVLRKNRIIHRKNQSLTQQITEAMIYKERYMQQMAESTRSADKPTDPDKLTDEQLFQYINDIIVRERLFLNQNFDRQTIMDRFQLSKERVGAAIRRSFIRAPNNTKYHSKRNSNNR